jgi:hypothetical protein
MAARRWADLSGRQRAALLTMASVQVGLAVAAWTDLARRPASQVRGSKGAWALVIGVNFVGPLAYYRWGRRPQG